MCLLVLVNLNCVMFLQIVLCILHSGVSIRIIFVFLIHSFFIPQFMANDKLMERNLHFVMGCDVAKLVSFQFDFHGIHCTMSSEIFQIFASRK